MSRQLEILAGLILVALVAASCGGGDDTNGGSGGGAAGGGAGAGIAAPEDGAEVPSSFTLEFSFDEELGAPDTGLHHVHVFYDGNSDEYTVVESSTFEVEGLSPGEHTITASLRNADHSAAGSEDEIAVTVTGGASGGGDGGEDKEEDGGGDDGYRY